MHISGTRNADQHVKALWRTQTKLRRTYSFWTTGLLGFLSPLLETIFGSKQLKLKSIYFVIFPIKELKI